MANSWVVVANSARARIFDADIKADKFEEMTGLVHEQSRSRESDLTSDEGGRSFDSMGKGRHGLEKHVSPHDHEAEVFARQIVERLNAGLKAGAFHKIQLAAPPAFLGILRKCFGNSLNDRLDKVINKNFVDISPEEISDHFFGSHISKRAGMND